LGFNLDQSIIDSIIRDYPNIVGKELEKKYNISYGTIFRIAKAYNLKKSNNFTKLVRSRQNYPSKINRKMGSKSGSKGKTWEQKTDSLTKLHKKWFIKNYSNLTNQEIVQQLNVTMFFVKYMAKHLGLKKSYAHKLKLLENRRSKYKQGYFINKNNDRIFYRSSYELQMLKNLDNDDDVKKYIYEPFSIDNYTPDFYIEMNDGRSYLIEIKPERLVGYKNNQIKFNKAINYVDNNDITKFVIITENTLNNWRNVI